MAKSEEDLEARVGDYLTKRMKAAGFTYRDLAEALKSHGYPTETRDSVKSKMKRGTFSAAFMIAVAAALGIRRIDLQEI